MVLTTRERSESIEAGRAISSQPPGQVFALGLVRPVRPDMRANDSAFGAHKATLDGLERRVVGPRIKVHESAIVAVRCSVHAVDQNVANGVGAHVGEGSLIAAALSFQNRSTS
jgi:hypothetical protein